MMTDIGDFDFTTCQELGSSLSELFGLPQSETTGHYGEDLIDSSLKREGRFTGKPYIIKAVPTGYQSIRFDVFISAGSREKIRLSIEQSLGVI